MNDFNLDLEFERARSNSKIDVAQTNLDALMEGLGLMARSLYANALKSRMEIEEPKDFDLFYPELDAEYPQSERTFVTPDDARFSRILIRDRETGFADVFASGLETTLKSMKSISFPQLANEKLGKELQEETQKIVDMTIDSASLTNPEANTLDYSLYRTVVAIKLLDRQLLSADQIALDERNRQDRIAESKVAEANREISELKQQQSTATRQIRGLKQSLEAANAGLARLDRVTNDLSDARAEIAFLKEVSAVIEEQEANAATSDEIDLDNVTERFNQHGILFVGGNVNWIKRMQAVLPVAKFMNTDEIGRSKKIFQNAQVIVLNVGTMNHSMSWKVRAAISPNAKLYYINSQQSNVERSLRQLAIAKNKN